MKKFLAKLLGLLPWDGNKTVIGTIVWLITHYGVVLWPAVPWVEVIAVVEAVAALFAALGIVHWRLKIETGK